MKYNVRPTTKFQKDLKRIQRRGYDLSLLAEIIKRLAEGKPLPEKNKDHILVGDYIGCRECHITSDWLLVYEISKNIMVQFLESNRRRFD